MHPRMKQNFSLWTSQFIAWLILSNCVNQWSATRHPSTSWSLQLLKLVPRDQHRDFISSTIAQNHSATTYQFWRNWAASSISQADSRWFPFPSLQWHWSEISSGHSNWLFRQNPGQMTWIHQVASVRDPAALFDCADTIQLFGQAFLATN